MILVRVRFKFATRFGIGRDNEIARSEGQGLSKVGQWSYDIQCLIQCCLNIAAAIAIVIIMLCAIPFPV